MSAFTYSDDELEALAAEHDDVAEATERLLKHLAESGFVQHWNRPYDAAEVDAEAPGASWLPRSLSAALSGQVDRPAPTILERNDGRGLLYRGRINGLHAASGEGKSLASQLAGKQHLERGGSVLWFDFEDPNEELLVERLRLLGVADDAIATRVRYVNPQEPAGPDFVAHLVDLAEDWPDVLVVIDSVGEALGLNGLNEDRDLEVDVWKRLVCSPFERAGHTVLLIDHSTKAGPNDLHPSGSKRKRALISGASWLVEQTRPLSKDTPGTLRLTCAKDRHGNFRRREVGAFIHLDGTAGTFAYSVEAPEVPAGTDAAAVVLVRRLLAVLKAHPNGLSQKSLAAELRAAGKVKASHQLIADAIELAATRGALKVVAGPRGAKVHHYCRDLTDSEAEALT